MAAAHGQARNQCALRVNPDVDAGTHAKISTGKAENKFGVPIDRAVDLCAAGALPGLNMRGVAVHIGSQLSDLEPSKGLRQGGRPDAPICARGRQCVTHMPISAAGWACPTRRARSFPSPAEYAAMVARVTAGLGRHPDVRAGPRDLRQRGRAAHASVIRVKRRRVSPFVVVDAAMNDLARPAMYDAWHDFDGGEAQR
jgi:diaminopimelate decarboxylase